MKMRLYLIFEDTIKRIGLNRRIVEEAADRTMPRLAVYFEESNSVRMITRLHLDTMTFDDEGEHILSETDNHRIATALERAFFKDEIYGDNIAFLSDHKRNTLTEHQKKLLNAKLKKDFGRAWERFNPAAKARFWKEGVTE